MQSQMDALNADFSAYKAESTALLASTQAAHTAEKEELNGKLGMTQEQLAASRKELAVTIEQATANENQRQSEIAALEQTLASEKADNKSTVESMTQSHAAIQAELEGKLEAVQQTLEKNQQLHNSYAELNGQYTERGMLVTLAESDLQFAGGQATLTQTEPESLVRIANILNTHEDLRILLEGHTDSAGSDKLNQTLSENRAESVKQALVGLGVDETRIETAGLGESRPIASNQTFEGRRKNRRVEIYLKK
jgi:chemotaxis protein MotB